MSEPGHRANPASMPKRLYPKIRILIGAVVAIGPGKADLLEAIGRTGSISAAGREMGMSYRRAWLLVDVLNASFAKPLVTTATGGQRGGGAQLTGFGVDVLRRYRAIEAKAAASIERDLVQLASLVKAPRRRR
ncbi:MAG: winged helix-turn-helix domain-containing protein [Burkholderiales bacterium]